MKAKNESKRQMKNRVPLLSLCVCAQLIDALLAVNSVRYLEKKNVVS